MKKLKIVENFTVRMLKIIVERGPLTQRHHEIMMEFIERGIYERGHLSGPAPLPKSQGGPMRRSMTHAIYVFDLEEAYADEYLTRMRARITKAEKDAYAAKERR